MQLIYCLLSMFVFVNVANAQDSSTQTQASKINIYADTLLRANPEGAMVTVGINTQKIYKIDADYNIPSNELKLGGEIGINPSYAQFSVYSEWMPVLFFKLRLQYDHYEFLGQYGGLLSFSSSNQKYGDAIIENREGEEESTTGSRIVIKPLLRAKIGDFLLRNQFTLAQYYFGGEGPYFLESEYSVLLKNDDTLYANNFTIFYDVKINGKLNFFIGPYHEWINTKSANITNQRIGINLFFETQRNSQFQKQRFYARLGTYLEDRNRDGEYFSLLGYGLDF